MENRRISRKQVGWGGIRFCIPPDWEPAEIGRRYLLFETQAAPVMEIKWGPVRPPFSFDRHLRRLAGNSPGRKKIVFEKTPLPPAWKKALSGCPATGFQWKAPPASGRGALIFFPDAHHAFLVQFFTRPSPRTDATAASVLASVRADFREETPLWSLFDIRARIPGNLKLVRHRFSVGAFELVFADKKRTLTLCRWSPASVLTEGEDGLLRFAERQLGISAGTLRHGEVNGYSAVTRTRRTEGWRGKIPVFSRGRAPFQEIRVWHVADKNRLLGIRAAGKKPFPPGMLDDICENYRAVDPGGRR
ncbi:hypothetical protein DENIS_3416 [Desulfonema ishimotonii]|uniref:Uncharacterized protein n=1 Tax=Desulfonema ishimotonii TaxID=45657 RepID=A0A401FZP7_9BACT|nr:hypothetical protein [Desulfonema ishimotonii]GBC62444.1 hypothetical protein DENIS_3416 [Desulfonema ishimotonii]